MYEALKSINKHLAVIFEHDGAWYDDWKFYVGSVIYVAVWFKWLKFGYKRVFYIKAIFVFGLNLICISLAQDDIERGVFWVMSLCTLNAMFCIWLFWKKSNVLKDGGFSATNVYSSFDMSTLQISFIFVGQMVLLTFFLYSIYENLRDDKDDNGSGDMTYVFWVAAYISVQMSSIYNRGEDSAVGGVFHSGLWEDVLAIYPGVDFRPKRHNAEGNDDNAFGRSVVMKKWTIILRLFMDFIANGLAREVISTMLPILLMKSKAPQTFVMNALAVTFISKLDDITPLRFKVSEKAGHDGALTRRAEELQGLMLCCSPEEEPYQVVSIDPCSISDDINDRHR